MTSPYLDKPVRSESEARVPKIQFEPHKWHGRNMPDGYPAPFGYLSTAPTPQPVFELQTILDFGGKEVFTEIAEKIVTAYNSHDALLEVAKMVDAWGNGLRHHTAHEAKMVKAARATLSLAAGKETV